MNFITGAFRILNSFSMEYDINKQNLSSLENICINNNKFYSRSFSNFKLTSNPTQNTILINNTCILQQMFILITMNFIAVAFQILKSFLIRYKI